MASENEIQQEIDAIRNDSDHPFNHGDEKAQAHVENLYKRLYGGEPVAPPEPRIEGELSAEEEWELKAEAEQERLKREGELDQKAIKETVDNVRWQLSQKWGDKTDENFKAIDAFAQRTKGADVQRLALGLSSDLKAKWAELTYETEMFLRANERGKP
jgi:hypothetical protein